MDIIFIISIISLIIAVIALIPLIFLRKQLKSLIFNIHPKDYVAIFGPTGAGKTTLVNYLTGKPLPLDHHGTIGATSVGRIVFDLTGEQIHYFRTREMHDVGGEFLNQWRVIIKDQNPDGIIYIIDATNEENEIKQFRELYQLYDEILKDKLLSEIHLKVVLVLINKVDIWGTDEEIKRSKFNSYKDKFLPITDLFNKKLGINDIMIECVSLLSIEDVFKINELLRRFFQRIVNNSKRH